MITTILGRRSIRAGFTNRPIARETVDAIVRCGLAAPSSKNAQPWRIHVVEGRERLAPLADAVDDAARPADYVPIDPRTGRPRADWESTVRESADVLRSVPLGLFVENSGRFSAGRRTVAHAAEEVRENALVGYGLEMIGLGAAIQSMWLAAAAGGLVGVFMGDVVIAEDAIRAELGMDGDLTGVLALGYSDAPPTPKTMAADRVVMHDA